MDDEEQESKITSTFIFTALLNAALFDILTGLLWIMAFTPIVGFMFVVFSWGVSFIAWLTFLVMFTGSNVSILRKNALRRSTSGFVFEFFLGILPGWIATISYMLWCAKQEEKNQKKGDNEDTDTKEDRRKNRNNDPHHEDDDE